MLELSNELHILHSEPHSCCVSEQFLLRDYMSRLHIPQLYHKQMHCMSVTMPEMHEPKRMLNMHKQSISVRNNMPHDLSTKVHWPEQDLLTMYIPMHDLRNITNPMPVMLANLLLIQLIIPHLHTRLLLSQPVPQPHAGNMHRLSVAMCDLLHNFDYMHQLSGINDIVQQQLYLHLSNWLLSIILLMHRLSLGMRHLHLIHNLSIVCLLFLFFAELLCSKLSN